MTDGSASHGAVLATLANLLENSPNDRCWDLSRTSPKAATFQKAVVPPLPSSTSYPLGSENRSARPDLMRATSDLTGRWRCEVPIYVEPESASAASWAWRTLDGPLPNR